MIKKILVRDYLKGYGDMSAEERRAFVGRVGEWLAQDGARLLAMTDRPMARSQSLMTITTRWTAKDAKAVTEGIMLMSALVGVADTWLPTQIYMKSAYRAIRQVVSVLSEVSGSKFQVSGEVSTAPELPSVGAKVITRGSGKTSEMAKRTEGTQQTKMEHQPITAVAPTRSLSAISHQPSSAVVPARPNHIDQYVHLLPKATQERAAGYGELMRQLGEARDNMQLLMDDDHASAKSREQWAKQATKIDKKIRAIRKELNREWEKVAESGRVVIDSLGMAHLVPTSQCNAAQDGDGSQPSAIGQFPLSRLPVAFQPSDLSSEQKKRRRDLRKWLIDLRRGKEGKDREKRIEQWRVNWNEYLTLEPREKAMEDEKILEAAKHFGIDLTQITTN